MELVDIYNNKHEKLGYTKGRKELNDGEFRLSCFVWIINSNNELLVQQRLATAKKCPNMWETASGGAVEGDTPLSGAIREVEEELGIKINEENIRFIGSYARVNDFVEVFLLKDEIDVKKLKVDKEEVQNVKWMSINEFDELIEKGIACDTGYTVFKNYFENFYGKKLEFIDGKLVFVKA